MQYTWILVVCFVIALLIMLTILVKTFLRKENKNEDQTDPIIWMPGSPDNPMTQTAAEKDLTQGVEVSYEEDPKETIEVKAILEINKYNSLEINRLI